MAEDDEKSLGIQVLSRLGLFELVADISSGLLMMFLFGPLLFALGSILHVSSLNAQDLYTPFPRFASFIITGSETKISPWLVFAFALVLGYLSRAICVMYSVFTPRGFQKIIARVSYWQIRKWHGLPAEWTYERTITEFISQNPFHRVGESTYAEYRAALDDRKNEMNNFKSYWDYEAFLFSRAHHFYGLFLSFSVLYLLYGVFVIALQWHRGIPLGYTDIVFWIVLVLLSFTVTVCLLEEVIIHGVAFRELDESLLGRFRRNLSTVI